MAKYGINWIDRSAQNPPDTIRKGHFPTIAKDPTASDERKLLHIQYRSIVEVIEDLDQADKDKLKSLIGGTGTVLPEANLINLFQTDNTVTAEIKFNSN